MKSGRYLDFLDILLTAKDDDNKGLTDQEIRDEVDTFLFEGETQVSGRPEREWMLKTPHFFQVYATLETIYLYGHPRD